jgi:leucyl-tRNA synthetase
MKRYNPKELEPRWQKVWDDDGTYVADLDSKKPKYIAMSMFNYPSGAGIHIGHAMNYTISDVLARFKRQQGYESYHPVGWDSFGLPAENYAIKAGISPQESMAQIIPNYHKQYRAMGWSNDWTKEIAAHQPEYYKWSQWIFSEMHRAGLVYQDARMQWWCTKCQTVLANEQVIDDKCWRHDGPDDPIVAKKEVKQWFFKITAYADELLEATDDLNWTESVKLAQKNWIGRSQGAEIDFAIQKIVNPNPDMARTYIMGQQDISASDIESIGGRIDSVTDAGHICAEFPVANAKKFEELINEKMELGFWNEYLTNEQVVFIFKHKDGKLQRFVLSDKNAHEICALGNQFNNQPEPGPEETPWSWFTNNSWYAPVVPRITVFTTRPDTLFGATFMVVAPEHDLVKEITTNEQRKLVDDYATKTLKKTEVQRQQEADKQKTGVFTGAYAINPVNKAKIPIWIADYVLMGYGTGAIMAVPAHDQRDYEFAQKFELPITQVVQPSAPDAPISGEGEMMNSGKYDSMPSAEAREKIVSDLEKQGVAKSVTNYKMRDWSVSRQRYWGAPIPIINCPKDGPVLVPDSDLPVVLPELDDFQPSGDGRSALARAKDWLVVDCPKCGGPAERETDTLDTYIDSSWYMLRYFDPTNDKEAFSSKRANHWMPIDFYNGGDHATAHMLYARFVTRFLHKQGLLDNPEPFKKFLFNGKVTAQDGQMFSKSKGNGVDPLEIIDQGYGADALRTYLMFAAPLELWARWDPQGVPGTHRFLSRLWTLVQEYQAAPEKDVSKEAEQQLLVATNKMIRKVTEDIEENRYNTAISSLMAAVNELYKIKVDNLAKAEVWQESLESMVMCVAPFAPYIAEDLWHQLGHEDTVHIDHWPQWDDKYLVSDTVTIVVQVNGKVRANIPMPAGSDQESVEAVAKEDQKVAGYLEGQTIKKIIYIQDKILNIVI